MVPLPDLSRTIAALEAYDRANEKWTVDRIATMSNVEAERTWKRLEELAEAVGTAYGLDTADRNNPETCRALVRPGPAVPSPGTELSFLRRMVALSQTGVDPRDLLPASDYFQKLDTRTWKRTK